MCLGFKHNKTLCYKENDGTYVLMNYYNEAGLEGIIYYLDADRKHGKILSLDEALLPWYKWNSSNNKASYPVSDWINTKSSQISLGNYQQ